MSSKTSRERLQFAKAQIHEVCMTLLERTPDMTSGELAMFLSGISLTCDYLAKLDGHLWINPQLVGKAAVEYGQDCGLTLGRLVDAEATTEPGTAG